MVVVRTRPGALCLCCAECYEHGGAPLTAWWHPAVPRAQPSEEGPADAGASSPRGQCPLSSASGVWAGHRPAEVILGKYCYVAFCRNLGLLILLSPLVLAMFLGKNLNGELFN